MKSPKKIEGDFNVNLWRLQFFLKPTNICKGICFVNFKAISNFSYILIDISVLIQFQPRKDPKNVTSKNELKTRLEALNHSFERSKYVFQYEYNPKTNLVALNSLAFPSA